MKAEKKEPKKRTPALAVVSDRARRAGVRVVPVEVVEIFEGSAGAMVEERTAKGVITHFLGFNRLATKRPDLAKKLREYLARERRVTPSAPPAENPPSSALAGAGGAEKKKYYWETD